jgi:hypothetical protein
MNYKTLNYLTLKAALRLLKTPEERARLLRAAGWTEEEFKMDSLLEQADTGEINSGDALAQMFAIVNDIATDSATNIAPGTVTDSVATIAPGTTTDSATNIASGTVTDSAKEDH